MAENIELKNNFSDNELKSIAVNAMGRASEAGSLAVMKLGLAVNVKKDGEIQYTSKNNSGYSVGFFQHDFGQQKNGKEFIDAYNSSAYVKEHPEKAVKSEDIDKYAKMLNQNRDSDDGATKYDTLRRSDIGKDFNKFLATDDGYKFVMSLQEKNFNKTLKANMESALKTPAVQNMSKEDAQLTLAAIAKVSNQAGANSQPLKSLINQMSDENNLMTKDQIVDKIYSSYGKVVDQGVEHTLRGAELYNTLSSQESGKLGEIFRDKNKENPMNIPDFKTSPKDQLMDSMFRSPDKAQKLIEAVNSDKDYVIKAPSKARNEAYTIGVKDKIIFTADKDGKGYKLEDGEWKEFDNNKEHLFQDQVKSRNTQNKSISPKEDKVVKELQENLNILKENGMLSGDKLATDGVLGRITKAAIKEFQEKNGLPATGIAENNTVKALKAQIVELNDKNIVLQNGTKGDRIKELQENLNTLKENGVLSGDKLATDGVFGRVTQAAVQEFQEKNGLPATGIAENNTIELLKAQAADFNDDSDMANFSLEDLIAKDLGISSKELSDMVANSQLRQDATSKQSDNQQTQNQKNDEENNIRTM